MRGWVSVRAGEKGEKMSSRAWKSGWGSNRSELALWQGRLAQSVLASCHPARRLKGCIKRVGCSTSSKTQAGVDSNSRAFHSTSAA